MNHQSTNYNRKLSNKRKFHDDDNNFKTNNWPAKKGKSHIFFNDGDDDDDTIVNFAAKEFPKPPPTFDVNMFCSKKLDYQKT